MVGAISDRDRVRDIGLRACSGTGQLGLRREHRRAEERQCEREETCTHLILLRRLRTTPSSSKTPKEDEMRTPFLPLAPTVLGAQVLARQTKRSVAGQGRSP